MVCYKRGHANVKGVRYTQRLANKIFFLRHQLDRVSSIYLGAVSYYKKRLVLAYIHMRNVAVILWFRW